MDWKKLDQDVDIKEIKLEGITIEREVLGIYTKSFTLTDTKGNVVKFYIPSSYENIEVYVPKPPEKVEEYKISGVIEGIPFEKIYKEDYNAQSKAEALEAAGIEVTLEKVIREGEEILSCENLFVATV